MLAIGSSQRFHNRRKPNGIQHAIIAFIIVATSAGGAAGDVDDEIGITESGAPVPGGQAPDFVLRDLAQNPIKLSAFRGRPVVLNFFASWCSPCLLELPIIQEAYLTATDGEFVVLGVSYQDSRWAIEELAEDVGLTFPIVIDGDNSVGQAYEVIGPPYTYFIDADGMIVEVVAGAMDRETLQRNLDVLLKTS